MSRFVPGSDMSAAQIESCSREAMAIVGLCSLVSEEVANLRGKSATDLAVALKLAGELIEVVHGVVRIHEGLNDGGRRDCTS